MLRLRKLVPSLFLAALLVALPACDSDSPLSPESLAGTYNLVSVNGSSLPVVLMEFEEDEVTVTFSILSGSVTLSATSATGGTYTAVLTFQEAYNGESDTWVDGGTGNFSVSGNTIVLEDADGEDDDVIGTVSGNQISLSLEDSDLGTVTLVFQR
jgi:hypothetical protein